MTSTTLIVNGKRQSVDVDPETPLLWVLRDTLGLTGTKYSCGQALCGTCTVLLDGEAIRSCVMPIEYCEGKVVTTIEGLSADGSHPLQRAWIEEDVPQCGYCQPGMLMSAVALLQQQPNPSDEDVEAAFAEQLWRGGTYNRVRRAIHRASRAGGLR